MAEFKKYYHYSSVFTGSGAGRDVQEILGLKINVEGQKEIRSVSAKNFKTFTDLANIDAQREYLNTNGPSIFEAISDIIDKLAYDKDLIRYTLPLLDGILNDDRNNIQFIIRNITNNGDKSIINGLQRILADQSHNITVHEAAAKVLAFIYSELDVREYGSKQKEFLSLVLSIRDTKQNNQNIKIQDYNFATTLVNLLKVEHLVVQFLKSGGASVLAQLLEQHSGDLQISYYLLLNIWLISYIEESYVYFADSALGLIRLVTEVIQKLSREKLVRVSFSTFRNLCAQPDTIELMVDAKLIKFIDILLKGNIKDEDVLEDLKYVGEILEVNLKILSSFEKYQKEIYSQQLDWSPVHSEKFWRENIKKFEDDDFKMIKLLISLLDGGNVSAKNQAIACYDIGEFCRFHPFGRNVLEAAGGKSKIMLLAKSSDQAIRENALLALQKIMLHNWNIQVSK